MAIVDNITQHPGVGPGVQRFRCQLTGATSTIDEAIHKFGGSLDCVEISVEGTNTMTWTRSGRTITVTGTNDDWVNIVIYGQK